MEKVRQQALCFSSAIQPTGDNGRPHMLSCCQLATSVTAVALCVADSNDVR